MNEVLQANLFFFITGVAVIVFVAMLSVAIFHVIKLIKSVRRIVSRIEQGTETLGEDMQHLRIRMTRGDGLARKLMRFMFGSSTARENKKEDDKMPLKNKKSERK